MKKLEAELELRKKELAGKKIDLEKEIAAQKYFAAKKEKELKEKHEKEIKELEKKVRAE